MWIGLVVTTSCVIVHTWIWVQFWIIFNLTVAIEIETQNNSQP